MASWFRRRRQGPGLSAQPDGFRLPASLNLPDDVEPELRDLLWHEVLLGRTDPDDMLDLLQDELDAWGIDDSRADQAAQAVVRARSEQQAHWPAGASVSNLSAAFRDLADIGVVARDHFSCCGACASTEIRDEGDNSRIWRGYVYFHQQDTAMLLEDRSTYIGYGVFLNAWMSQSDWAVLSDKQKDERYTELVTALLTDEIFPLLRGHGISVTWNGDLGTRVLLENADYFVPV